MNRKPSGDNILTMLFLNYLQTSNYLRIKEKFSQKLFNILEDYKKN
ncbi:hypothetical protein CM15mP43_08010 [bacterium]|nr:MAG: hypothetical protein CM15mP43_08010 [bacterium]